ncbi:MAG TPA: hypothetical protein VNV42_10165 [Solirubrobacteraceae bacterium]|jgi:hypothetical protein|nr:hypothetical protein [Solirubrobacteraceae bacterium]
MTTLARRAHRLWTRPRRPASCGLPVALAVATLAIAAPAQAKQTRVFAGYFGAATSNPADPYPLSEPSGVAVNQVSHDIYVGDLGNDRVEEFSDTGEFLLMFGKEVNETAVEEHRSEAEQDTCPDVGHPADICQAGAATAGSGGFDTPGSPGYSLYLAVDNSSGPSAGDVYVGDITDGLVQKFDSTGHLLASWGEHGHFQGGAPLSGVAVDGRGDLWVYGDEVMYELSQEGSRMQEWHTSGPSRRGLAIDPEGNLYLGATKFTSLGAELGDVADMVNDIPGVAVDPTTNTLYAYEQAESLGSGTFIGRYDLSSCQPSAGRPCARVETFGEDRLPRVPSNFAGLAVDGGAAADTLYAAAWQAGEVASFPVVNVPDVTTGLPSDLTQMSATLNGTINPAGVALSEGLEGCRFEWGETEAYGHTVACAESAAQIGAGSSAVAVHADLAGLTPGASYHYRLVAANANDVNARIDEPSLGRDARFGPPRVDEESVEDVTATTASFKTQVDPMGADTHARLEYLTEAEYQQNGESFAGAHPAASVPVPEADLGKGDGDVPLAPALEGLAPATVYRYHVVAQSVLGTVEGATLTLTTQTARASLTLLDGRQWELVSPPVLNGALLYSLSGSVLSGAGVIQAADDGKAITYLGDAPTESGPEGNANSIQILSVRGPSGWNSRDIASAHSAATQGTIVVGEEYRMFSADLSLGLLQPFGALTPSLSPEAVEQGPYLRTDLSVSDPGAPCVESCYQPIVTRADDTTQPFQPFGQPCPRHELGAYFCGPLIEGASPDLEHVVISSTVPLTETGGAGLYEWSSTAPPGEALRFIGAGQLGNGTGYRKTDHAVSDDGSRVFVAPTRFGVSMHDRASGGTVAVTSAGEFEDASADGSRVIFRENVGEATNLYECHFVEQAGGQLGCETTDISPMNGAEPAQVQGTILGASEDGTYVYFVADGVLASNAGADGTHAAPGGCVREGHSTSTCNLYVWHEDAATGESTITFIAALSQEDNYDWSRTDESSPELSTARVSPNGHWLAFMSERSLTGYDNRDAVSGERDEEVYLYHTPATEGEASGLVCASCNPTGARPHGLEGSSEPLQRVGGPTWPGWVAGSIPTWVGPAGSEPNHQPRYLSNSGRLFFDSTDALVPQDVNGTEDVYEYEPPVSAEEAPPNDGCGTGSPTYSSASGGCVNLISSGSSPSASVFLDASENGNDVFFLSSAQLAVEGSERGPKVYDAHVCTSESLCPPPTPSPPPACEGDACQSATGVLDDPTPGSLTFQGPGDPAAAPPTPAVKPKTKAKAPKKPVRKAASALKACKRRPKRERVKCEKRVERRYGTASRAPRHQGGER